MWMCLGHQTLFSRNPVILSENDWGVQSHPQHSIWVTLPFSEGDWIPRDYDLLRLYTLVFQTRCEDRCLDPRSHLLRKPLGGPFTPPQVRYDWRMAWKTRDTVDWLDMWVFPKIGGKPPKWMVKIMENPMYKWMIWGVLPPLFLVQHPCKDLLKRCFKYLTCGGCGWMLCNLLYTATLPSTFFRARGYFGRYDSFVSIFLFMANQPTPTNEPPWEIRV